MEGDSVNKKGLFSRIAGALFQEVEVVAGEPSSPPAPVPPGPPASAAEMEGQLAEEDKRLLRELAAEIAGQGELLTRFAELVLSLGEIIPQEAACYQAALKALEKTSGTRRDDLLAAVASRMKALVEEKTEFQKSVEGKLAALQASSRKGAEIRARIEAMQKTILELEKEEQAIYAGMAQEERLVRTAQVRFDKISGLLERSIQGEGNKIRAYLAEAPSPK